MEMLPERMRNTLALAVKDSIFRKVKETNACSDVRINVFMGQKKNLHCWR
jgi:hypothetical protein